jgi:alanine racemase
LSAARFSIDRDAVGHNVRQWRARLRDRELWAVVKADAYGMGAPGIARTALDAGAARLVVFDVEEAEPLRSAGIGAPIVQVFATPVSELADALRLRVIPSVADAASARMLSEMAQWRARRVVAHVAIDTGTGWSGVAASRAGEFARELRGMPGVVWEGAWTHVSSRESMDAQLRAFASAVAAMRDEGIAVPIVHAASTGPSLWGRSTGASRIGVGLYGSTLGETSDVPALRTAVRLVASVLAVKRFDVATPLGYGGVQTAEPGDRVATLGIGYADGLPTTLGAGEGFVQLAGERCAIAGAIGMNTTMVRLPVAVRPVAGDEALLLGDVEDFRLDDVAKRASMIPHALLTSLANASRAKSLRA